MASGIGGSPCIGELLSERRSLAEGRSLPVDHVDGQHEEERDTDWNFC